MIVDYYCSSRALIVSRIFEFVQQFYYYRPVTSIAIEL